MAFQRLPSASYNLDGIEFRDDAGEGGYSPEGDNDLDDDECSRAGIPPDPTYTRLMANQTTLSVAHYDKFLAMPDIDEKFHAQLEAERREAPSQATVFRYLAGKSDDQAEFREQYARALMFRTYHLAELALDVAFDEERDFEQRTNAQGQPYVALNPTSVQRARLKCDELHWHIERLNGVKYGKPVQIDPNAGAGDGQIIMQFIDYRDLPDEPPIPKRPPNLTIDRRGGEPPPATAFDDDDDF